MDYSSSDDSERRELQISSSELQEESVTEELATVAIEETSETDLAAHSSNPSESDDVNDPPSNVTDEDLSVDFAVSSSSSKLVESGFIEPSIPKERSSSSLETTDENDSQNDPQSIVTDEDLSAECSVSSSSDMLVGSDYIKPPREFQDDPSSIAVIVTIIERNERARRLRENESFEHLAVEGSSESEQVGSSSPVYDPYRNLYNFPEIPIQTQKEKLNISQEVEQLPTTRNEHVGEETAESSQSCGDFENLSETVIPCFSSTKLEMTETISSDSQIAPESNATELASDVRSLKITSESPEYDLSRDIVGSFPSTLTGISRSSEVQGAASDVPSVSQEINNQNIPASSHRVGPALDEDEQDEVNGVVANKFESTEYVVHVVPLLEQLQNDLLEIKAFLDGTGRAICDPADDPDYGPTLDERLLASITDDFGTGVESVVAQNTRLVLSEWVRTQQCVEQAAAGTASTEPEASAQGNPTSDSPKKPSLDSKLDAVTNPADVSRQLLRLNRIARRYLHNCMRSTRNVLSYCVTGNPRDILPVLEQLVIDILEVLEKLVTLRQDCSDLLKDCRSNDEAERVLYILKVKTQIASAYNRLLQNILTLTSKFREN